MAYIVGMDRNQTRMMTISLDELIDKDNYVRSIDAYVEWLDLQEFGFTEYSGLNRGQFPCRRSDLLKLHVYGYLNKIKSSRALEVEARRNIELMWLILVLKGWGLIDGKLIAIHATKIKAQNSKHNCIAQSGLYKKQRMPRHRLMRIS